MPSSLVYEPLIIPMDKRSRGRGLSLSPHSNWWFWTCALIHNRVAGGKIRQACPIFNWRCGRISLYYNILPDQSTLSARTLSDYQKQVIIFFEVAKVKKNDNTANVCVLFGPSLPADSKQLGHKASQTRLYIHACHCQSNIIYTNLRAFHTADSLQCDPTCCSPVVESFC